MEVEGGQRLEGLGGHPVASGAMRSPSPSDAAERNPSLLERLPECAERRGRQGRDAKRRAAAGGASHP
jgi:hypothetical protein